MPIFQYGTTEIEWEFKLDSKLSHHYVTVERGKKVLLRGPNISVKEQQELIRYRARWIKLRLVEVNQPLKDEIVTGSRAPYRGRSFYCEVIPAPELSIAEVSFNQSRFKILSPEGHYVSRDIFKAALERFYKQKAQEKIGSRLRYWQKETGLEATTFRIKKFDARWANCTENNVLEFHPRCMTFSNKAMDYVIIHELCHTIEKSHNKLFWKLITKFCPDWKELHDEVEHLGMDL
ncbi:YgjP family zinc-dependent metalloprotease [Aliivibrio sp. S2MY1]|uniref:YgjP family zinc-dependent metalloprotease n=1 Tax=Aliivibrio sp. S2MY1 TaxID=3028423 RepID=UPI002379A1BB|nr:SprT family zinc-dependent metalloprotease [Aliivibrio sp. S2MY1]MDD9199534.1 SprT family zinc-dependent metalloprotease [Aliivibrio sp. S2MY1]